MRKTKPRSPAPASLDTIYPTRQPRRPHYLRDWMEHRSIESQAELAEAIGADKSVVSRWLDEERPTTPGIEWQKRLGAYFGSEDDPVDIFRHPLDDWISKFFRDRNRDEIERIKQTMETAFPVQRSRR